MTSEQGRGQDGASVNALVEAPKETGVWHARWQIDKYHDGIVEGEPDEVLKVEGNVLCNAGIVVMLDLLARGGAGPVYSNGALAYLAAGSSAAAEDPTDTILTAELAREQASAVVTDQGVAFQATFGAGTGTGNWEEVGVLNAAAIGDLLNHLVGSLGAKGGSAAWVLTLTITIS